MAGGSETEFDPEGLATEDTLQSIDGKLPPLASGRVPVDIGGASVTIEGDVIVTFDSIQISPAEFATPFGADENRVTTYYNVQDYASIGVSILTDQNSATNGAKAIFSRDGTDAGIVRIATATIPATTSGVFFAVDREASYVKFDYTNGPVAQGSLKADIIASFQALTTGQVPAGATITDLNTGGIFNGLGRARHSSGAWFPLVTDGSNLLVKTSNDATYKAGTASAAGVFIDAFEVGNQGFFTLTGTTTGSWQDAAGQAGLIAVEGTNDPAGITGWSALRMENPNGQTTTAPRGSGTFHGEVTTRWLRVNCLVFKAGTYVANLVIFSRSRQLFKHWIGDQDGISRVEVTPGTSRMHTVTPTPLLTLNFDVVIPDDCTVTATGSGSAAIVVGQGVKLQTGTTPDSTIRIQSNRVADIVPGLANIVNFFAATEAKAGVGNVTRWGAYDDDSGVFLEQYHDGTAGQLRLRTRKAGVDTTVTLNGTNNISDNGFGVPVYNLYDFYIDPAFVKFRQSGILGALASGLFPTLFSKFNLPLRAEIINSGGASTNKTLYIQYASTVRLGPPQTIRADQPFQPDDVLSAGAVVVQAQQPDGDFVIARADGEAFISTTPLPASGSVVASNPASASGCFDTDGYNTIEVGIFSDVEGSANFEYCDDIDSLTPNFFQGPVVVYGPDDVGFLRTYPVPVSLDGFQATFTNNPITGQTAPFVFAIQLRTTAPRNPRAALNAVVDEAEEVLLTRGALMAPDGNGLNHQAIGRDGGGSSLNARITTIDDGFKLDALRHFENGHLNVGPTRVQIPPPPSRT